MSNRLIISGLMIFVLGLMSIPATQAQLSTQGAAIRISAYNDDPFANEAKVERMDASRFNLWEDGRPFLSNSRAAVEDESFIYRQDRVTGEYKPFAWNPWPLPVANEKDNFKFPDEPRFPLFEIERGPDGKPVLVDGLQVWKPLDLFLGLTTSFKAANDDKDAAEFWSGRDINWGVLYNQNQVLFINSHSFTDLNAFYSPTARQVFLGVAAYRLPGETAVKMFETATSWEMVAHECAHALHHTMKPNIDLSDQGYRAWAESFADLTAMWASLVDEDRAKALLKEVAGDLLKSNSLTRFVEAFGGVTGKDTCLRDAFHDKRISDTTDEIHDRSEPFTGAVYKVFTDVYNDLKNRQGVNDLEALQQAGDIMGIFLTRSTDYTPENSVTLEDVGKAYLKVDKEFFGGRYHNMIVDEFTKREIFDVDSVAEWMEHDAAIPNLRLAKRASDQDVDNLVQANLDKLGIGPEFGLKLQSVTRDRRFGQTIVRVQLTDRRTGDASLFENHGILTFRANRTLADYHPSLPVDTTSQMNVQSTVLAPALVSQAKRFGLDRRGGLSFVRSPKGHLTVEARVMRSEGFYSWVEAFTMEHPEGKRREVITPTVPRTPSGLQPNGVRILTADNLNE